MDDGSILGSLDRIETAIARIEVAAWDRSPPVPAATQSLPDAELERRHLALKTAVEQALARIDTLIGEQP